MHVMLYAFIFSFQCKLQSSLSTLHVNSSSFLKDVSRDAAGPLVCHGDFDVMLYDVSVLG